MQPVHRDVRYNTRGLRLRRLNYPVVYLEISRPLTVFITSFCPSFAVCLSVAAHIPINRQADSPVAYLRLYLSVVFVYCGAPPARATRLNAGRELPLKHSLTRFRQRSGSEEDTITRLHTIPVSYENGNTEDTILVVSKMLPDGGRKKPIADASSPGAVLFPAQTKDPPLLCFSSFFSSTTPPTPRSTMERSTHHRDRRAMSSPLLAVMGVRPLRPKATQRAPPAALAVVPTTAATDDRQQLR